MQTTMPDTPRKLIEFTAARPILHTDDDSGSLLLVKMMLERLGYSVISAVSSADALRICQTQPISLVISDVLKPKMSGLDLLQHLRTNPSTRAITFTFLTTRCDTITMQDGLSLGADDYLCQPVPMRELAEKTQELLQKSLRQSEELPRSEFTGEGMGETEVVTFGGYSVEAYTGDQWSDIVVSPRKLADSGRPGT